MPVRELLRDEVWKNQRLHYDERRQVPDFLEMKNRPGIRIASGTLQAPLEIAAEGISLVFDLFESFRPQLFKGSSSGNLPQEVRLGESFLVKGFDSGSQGLCDHRRLVLPFPGDEKIQVLPQGRVSHLIPLDESLHRRRTCLGVMMVWETAGSCVSLEPEGQPVLYRRP